MSTILAGLSLGAGIYLVGAVVVKPELLTHFMIFAIALNFSASLMNALNALNGK